uniref:Uncharacterized protein n=1 Tax=Arion vulgaris TaxID=1028688 RepID=A0A0B7AK08_9EUPU
MPTSQWMNIDVPGDERKLVSLSFSVPSNIDNEQMSSHQPQTNGNAPISITTKSFTLTTT